jgi:hypothetical protein
MKKRWKEILFIVVAAVVIAGMGTTAISNVKGLFNKEETKDSTNDTTTQASIVCVDETL